MQEGFFFFLRRAKCETDVSNECFCSLQYNAEHRQREMEEQKREKLQQLIQKNKDEQSEYRTASSRATFVFRVFPERPLTPPLSHRQHFLEKLGISNISVAQSQT